MKYEVHLEQYTPAELFAMEQFFASRPNAERAFKDILGTISELIISCSARTHETMHLTASEHEIPRQRESAGGIVYDSPAREEA